MPKHVVIVGNGITGVTAARFIRKLSDYRITMISAESDHFYSRTALMYIYMGHMRYEDTKPYEDWFWAKNRIDLVRDFVLHVDTETKAVHLASGITLPYDVLVLATGSKSNKFGWPGQDAIGVQGLYGLTDLALMEQRTQNVERAVIVGGGLIGIEMAEMLHARHIPVTFLVREEAYMSHVLPPEEAEMVNAETRLHGIDLRLSTELKAILPDVQGRVEAVVTTAGERIPCQFVGLTVGVHPNLDVVAQSSVETNRGILIDHYFRTNRPDVYAGGDCAEFQEPLPGRKAVEQLWYTGRMHGKAMAYNIVGQDKPYDPGVFFNSAKFFDVEYQTYGDIAAQLPSDQETLFWQHENGRHSIRINYRAADQVVTGFNLMGVRYRQAVCEGWLKAKATLPYVLENLGAANFDPEFFAQYEHHLIDTYRRQHPQSTVLLKRQRGLFAGIFS